MTRMTNEELVRDSLKGYPSRPYIFREEAGEILREITGQDFGDDVHAWLRWLDGHKYSDRMWRRAINNVLRKPRRPILVCFQTPCTVETLAPTPQQVRVCIEELNGDDRYGVLLSTTLGKLKMWGGKEDRIATTFSGIVSKRRCGLWVKREFYAELLDLDVANPDKEILIKVGSSEIVKRLCETVTKEIAAEITIHFLEHNTLPKGFRWTKDVEPYT